VVVWSKRWPITKTISGFPISQRVKLNYFHYEVLDTGGTTLGYFDLRANGVYDPVVAVGGHQPLGYDQWSTFYNNWVVLACDIHTNFKSNVASENTQIVGIILSDDTTTPMEVGELAEQPLAHWTTVCCNAGNRAFADVRHRYDAKTFFNIKDPLDNVSRLGGTTGADPTEQAYFRVYFNNSNGGISDTTLQTNTLLTYDVVFSEPKALAQS
jgi:hypothetical protein